MSERRRRLGPVPRWRRITARLAALAALLPVGGSLYLVADGVGLSTDDLGGDDDGDPVELHTIATFGAGKDEDLAVGEGGRVGVIFRRKTSSGTQTLARLGTSKGGFGPLKRLSRTSSTKPLIAINAEGVAAALWVSVNPAGVKRLQTAIAVPGRRFGAARTLDRTLGWIKLTAVSVSEDGDVTATWRRDGRAKIAQRQDGRFTTGRPITGESAISAGLPDLNDREEELIEEVKQRRSVARIVKVVAAGDHVVTAYRETEARKGHLEIVSIY